MERNVQFLQGFFERQLTEREVRYQKNFKNILAFNLARL